MKSAVRSFLNLATASGFNSRQASAQAAAEALHWVSRHETQDLERSLAAGRVPPDFERKLTALNAGDVLHHFISQNVRLFLALLLAAQEGLFRMATAAQRERLLSVLAYVRKDEDAIPDYRTDGFADDFQVVRAAAQELAPLIEAFKLWRLRHQVPRMWACLAGPAKPARLCFG